MTEAIRIDWKEGVSRDWTDIVAERVRILRDGDDYEIVTFDQRLELTDSVPLDKTMVAALYRIDPRKATGAKPAPAQPPSEERTCRGEGKRGPCRRKPLKGELFCDRHLDQQPEEDENWQPPEPDRTDALNEAREWIREGMQRHEFGSDPEGEADKPTVQQVMFHTRATPEEAKLLVDEI